MPDNESLDNTLKALRIAVEQLLISNKPPEVDPRRHFYKTFNQEADEYDRDFHKKYHDDLNTTLIFAGLFSTVASAFIVDIQQELRPDYNEMSFTVLTMLLNATSGVPNHPDIPVVSGPKASAVQVQSILFGSLASSLLAAFLAMLGKQWLNLHVEGSLIDRSRHRELRMRGMITWRFKLIMECLPFAMQLSLLLLGYALAQYMWDLSRSISTVITSFTAFGVLLYLFIVFAATFWKTCPFQTPVSIALRHIISLARQRRHRRLQNIQNRLSSLVHVRTGESFATAMSLGGSFDGELALEPLYPLGISTSATTMPNLEDESTHSSDTNCISTMLRFASASDAIVAVTGFIPEVNWTSNVRKVPLLEVFHSLYRSFEFLRDGRVIIRPGMKRQAYGSAKALLHLRMQRICVGAMDDSRAVALGLAPLLGYHSKAKEDHELDSTIRMLDSVFNADRPIAWDGYTFGDAHYCWLSHILRLRTWVTLRLPEHSILTKDVRGFVEHAFSQEKLPPSQVIADCLLIVNMTIGIGRLPELDDGVLVKDKSAEIEDVLQLIYQRLKLAFASTSPTTKRQRATIALELMVPLKQKEACIQSAELFRTIMTDAVSDGSLWDPAGLSLAGAFKWDMVRPVVKDTAPFMCFLRRCLSEQEEGLPRDKPIEYVMHAIAAAPADEVSEGLARVDFTEPLFFNGICRALRKDAPTRLRRLTVILLRHLDAQYFNTDKTFSKEQATMLVDRWSASGKKSWDTKLHPVLGQALVATLMGLLDSPFWREYIPEERWDILKLLGGVNEAQLPHSFYRCLSNTEILPYLEERSDHGSGACAQWLAIMWAWYPDLSDVVRTQLEGTTKKQPQNNISIYLSITQREREQVRVKLASHHSWSFEEDEGIIQLRAKYDELRIACGKLSEIAGKPAPQPSGSASVTSR